MQNFTTMDMLLKTLAHTFLLPPICLHWLGVTCLLCCSSNLDFDDGSNMAECSRFPNHTRVLLLLSVLTDCQTHWPSAAEPLWLADFANNAESKTAIGMEWATWHGHDREMHTPLKYKSAHKQCIHNHILCITVLIRDGEWRVSRD